MIILTLNPAAMISFGTIPGIILVPTRTPTMISCEEGGVIHGRKNVSEWPCWTHIGSKYWYMAARNSMKSRCTKTPSTIEEPCNKRRYLCTRVFSKINSGHGRPYSDEHPKYEMTALGVFANISDSGSS